MWLAARRPVRLIALTIVAMVAVPVPNAIADSSRSSSRAPKLLALHATRGDRPAIVDAQGRQVILRGVNLNSFGDYYQADRRLPTVVPVTDSDWADMARHGLNVVRLIVSWSKLEPQRGVFSRPYLRRIHAAVDAARAHGIYTVIDMHQDAWGRFIASPPAATCSAGRESAIGWDGAPRWATLTDGADTCRAGSRENSEAVLTAWDSFYANRDGIMDELVATWGKVAREFTAEPAVAGYDLLNEPNHGHDSARVKAALGTYYARAITAIRAAEHGRAAMHHIAFFETTVYGVSADPTFTTDDNVVFAPHNYGESIVKIPLEALFALFANLAREYGTAMWVGEYGWFSDPPAQAAKLTRYAAEDDTLITAGDAWWQWRQACGDPHTIGRPGGTPDPVLIHFRRNRCPGDRDGGIVQEWACVWRPYPRATPGRLTSLRSTCRDELELAGHTDQPGRIEVWFPKHGAGGPRVDGARMTRVKVVSVPGGWQISARVDGDFTLRARG